MPGAHQGHRGQIVKIRQRSLIEKDHRGIVEFLQPLGVLGIPEGQHPDAQAHTVRQHPLCIPEIVPQQNIRLLFRQAFNISCAQCLLIRAKNMFRVLKMPHQGCLCTIPDILTARKPEPIEQHFVTLFIIISASAT